MSKNALCQPLRAAEGILERRRPILAAFTRFIRPKAPKTAGRTHPNQKKMHQHTFRSSQRVFVGN